MADTSPGSKVQALRAMFAQKNEPVMGMLPPGGKLGVRPWKHSTATSKEEDTLRKLSLENENIIQYHLPVGNVLSPENLKMLSSAIKSKSEIKESKNGEYKMDTNSRICDIPVKLPFKPCVGPKPVVLIPSSRTASNFSLNSSHSCNSNDNQLVDGKFQKTALENSNCTNTSKNTCSVDVEKSRTMGETIASFMFVGNSMITRENGELNGNMNNNCTANRLPIPKPRMLTNNHTRFSNVDTSNNSNIENDSLAKNDVNGSCSNIINSDNYICKSNCKFKRKDLPLREKLGPAPLKPFKPAHMKLPDIWGKQTLFNPLVIPQVHSAKPVKVCLPPQKSVPPTLQRPAYPCPPRPAALPPGLPQSLEFPSVPSYLVNVEVRGEKGKNIQTEEMEELYEDTLVDDKTARPISLIPEYTEEEEKAGADIEDLYDDAGEDITALLNSQSPVKPKMPPPPPPSSTGTLGASFNDSSEELYQDAIDVNEEEFYEIMPVDLPQEDPGAPLYSNNKKELERLRREEEKRIRREQKEREKKEREMDKVRRKFSLTGQEIPIDAGLVKSDSRGGRNDLPVKRGETVLILRMEGNPSGKWLVKNERGKIGYVELTNIEVDPDSVKSVMTVRRVSTISTSEELYSEALSEEDEEEAIYEVTY